MATSNGFRCDACGELIRPLNDGGLVTVPAGDGLSYRLHPGCHAAGIVWAARQALAVSADVRTRIGEVTIKLYVDLPKPVPTRELAAADGTPVPLTESESAPASPIEVDLPPDSPRAYRSQWEIMADDVGKRLEE